MALRTPEDVETDPDNLIRLGAVASVDLAAARCTVTFDDDVTSPPLRWIEPRMGATRTWSPPSPGEQVVVLCPAGEIGAGLVLRGIVSDAAPPPGSGLKELIVFPDGAQIGYDPDSHELDIFLPAGASATIVADGGLTITGDVIVTGKLTASDDVIGGGKSLKNHKHTAVSAGTAQSGPPA